MITTSHLPSLKACIPFTTTTTAGAAATAIYYH